MDFNLPTCCTEIDLIYMFKGKAVDTEACGGTKQLDLHGSLSQGDWECRHGRGLAADRPEVTAAVGSKCRCGCVLNMNAEKTRTILAASTQACPGRSFWLVQVNKFKEIYSYDFYSYFGRTRIQFSHICYHQSIIFSISFIIL